MTTSGLTWGEVFRVALVAAAPGVGTLGALRLSDAALGVANGVFAIGAIGSDLARAVSGSASQGYTVKFLTGATQFMAAATLVGTGPRLAADRLQVASDDEGEQLLAVLG